MKVKLKKLNESFIIPEKAKEGDFCYDVWAMDEGEIAPNVWRYKLGFAYEIDRTTFNQLCVVNKQNLEHPEDINLSIDIRPRSSIWKTGMVLSNCEGTLN